MAQKQGSSKKTRKDKPGRPRGSQKTTGNRGARKAKLSQFDLAMLGKGNFQKAVNALKSAK